MQYYGPPPGSRSATWIVYTTLTVYAAYAAAITWTWAVSPASRATTTAVLIGLFVVSTAGCVAQAIGTGSRRDGRPTYYAMNRDGTWVPFVALMTPRRVATGPAIGAAILAVLTAGVFLRHGGPTMLDVVAFGVYTVAANGAMALSYRHVRNYHRSAPVDPR